MKKSSRVYASLLLVGLCAATTIAFGIVPLGAQESEMTAPPGPLTTPGQIPTAEVPYFADWAISPHADRTAEPFNHWNEEGAIPENCAKCHSTPGFRDFIGADGTMAGVVDHPAPVGTVINCTACHNPATWQLSSVTFPSGVTVDHLGAEARCMTCHQGRESTDSVKKGLAGMDDDTSSDKLRFINVHYAAAGATLMGSVARGAYQYPGKDYAGRQVHEEPYTTCVTCHDMHQTRVRVEDCAACHEEVTDTASLRQIRASNDTKDYDGDGNVTEGIAEEVQGLHDQLFAAIQTYAKDVAGTPVVYDPNAYPYFFVDSNANGKADADELRVPNQYKAWTPRLLRAAYNYQFVQKDPGAFAHNAPYVLQVMFDSIADLGSKADVTTGAAVRP